MRHEQRGCTKHTKLHTCANPSSDPPSQASPNLTYPIPNIAAGWAKKQWGWGPAHVEACSEYLVRTQRSGAVRKPTAGLSGVIVHDWLLP